MYQEKRPRRGAKRLGAAIAAVCTLLLLLGVWAVWNGAQAAMREQAAQSLRTAELDALLPHGTAREGPGVSAVLEGADGRSLSVFAELTADGGYRVIQWQQSAEWAGEAEAPALFGTLREG